MREVERKTGISRTSLRVYRDRAEASGKCMKDLLGLSDAELNAILVKGDGHRSRDGERYKFMQENVGDYALTMKRRYMTYEVLYEDYLKATDNPYGYTQFKAIIQEYGKKNDLKYHNVYDPGHEMQFDFAGDNLWIVNRSTGECLPAIVLVCVLPYSMLSYVTALPSAKMEFLFKALSDAVSYFGGVAELSKTDNMKQWIKKVHRYEPTLNEAAVQWCLHYGTALDECRSKKPRDKGPAESLVNQAYRFYYSRICRDAFSSYDELNRRLMALNDEYNNVPRKGHTYSRREQYEKEEQPFMLPLPPEPFRFKYEKQITINTTYHFQIDKVHFYSIPYQYVGKKAKVVFDADTVEVWVDLQRVAVHRRMYTDGYTTVKEHMPPRHQAYRESKEINAAFLIKKAGYVGPETRACVQCILDNAIFPQQAYRSCQGVLRLADKYTPERLEAACGRIEPKTAASYKRIENILIGNLDSQPLFTETMAPYIPKNDNVRGASAYQ